MSERPEEPMHNPGEPVFGDPHDHGEGRHNPGEPEFGGEHVDPDDAAEQMEDEAEGRS